nr:MAG TPA: helix-turn-helix domain protein [Caudoviricetes sp.]
MVGAKMKLLRVKNGYSVKDICNALDLPNRTYRAYELNEHTPPIELICKIADYYDVTVDWLLGRGIVKSTTLEDYQQRISKNLAEIKKCQEDISNCLEEMGIICPVD